MSTEIQTAITKLITNAQVASDQMPEILSQLIARQLLFSYLLFFGSLLVMFAGLFMAWWFFQYYKLPTESDSLPKPDTESYSIGVLISGFIAVFAFIVLVVNLPELISVTFYQKAWLMDYAAKFFR